MYHKREIGDIVSFIGRVHYMIMDIKSDLYILKNLVTDSVLSERISVIDRHYDHVG